MEKEKRDGRDGYQAYKEVSQTYDNSTGQIVEEKITTKIKVNREPDFIKLYLNDILLIQDISKEKTNILYELLRRMNYMNEIVLAPSIKKEIVQTVGTSLSTMDKALYELVKKGVLKRKDRSVFIANPYLFGKGKWEDIHALRLTIDYDKDGKRITTIIQTSNEVRIDDYSFPND